MWLFYKSFGAAFQGPTVDDPRRWDWLRFHPPGSELQMHTLLLESRTLTESWNHLVVVDLWIYISRFWCGLYYLYHFWIVVTTCDPFFSWPTIRFVERVKDELQEVSKGTSLCLFFADQNSKHHGIILRWPFILESEDEQLVLLLTSTSSCQTTCKFQWIRRDECWWRLPSKAFAAATPAAAWKRAWCKRPL